MNIKVIPTQLEVNLKNTEQPLKVQYVVELTTESYNDIMSSGLTYISNSRVNAIVDQLVDAITDTIHGDLGLQEIQSDNQPTIIEEEL